MVNGKCKNLTNRNQDFLAPSEHSSPSTSSPGYPNTLERQDVNLKSYLVMVIEDFKKDINNSLKEIQENTCKQVEALEEETQKIAIPQRGLHSLFSSFVLLPVGIWSHPSHVRSNSPCSNLIEITSSPG
jgi:FtsZ-binding cell division protein ZapB